MGPNKLYAKAIYGAEPQTMDELGHAVIKVLNEHRERHVSTSGRNRVYRESPKARCVGLSWRLTHSDLVSNSHSSPEGFPQNWGGKEGVPRGYPGWTGRVWVRYAKEEGYSFGSDPFRRSLVHTGTGGGGGYNGPWETISNVRFKRFGHARGKDMYPEICCYSWDCRIFDADWFDIASNIVREHEKAVMWATLNNSPKPAQPSHNFLWEDPEVKTADEAFLQEWKDLKNDTIIA